MLGFGDFQRKASYRRIDHVGLTTDADQMYKTNSGNMQINARSMFVTSFGEPFRKQDRLGKNFTSGLYTTYNIQPNHNKEYDSHRRNVTAFDVTDDNEKADLARD